MAVLLVIIYVSFISLGLPDSLLGSAWPSIGGDLGAPLGLAGALSMVISGGTIISSLNSDRLIAKLGTGRVTLFSVAATALALYGFSVSPNIYMMFLMAVPMGLGAGAVDSTLNNFVALHYKATHMSWLHCFWGIGATAGPVIMSLFLMRQSGWRGGYLTIAVVQTALVAVLAVTLPLWSKHDTAYSDSKNGDRKVLSTREVLRLPNFKLALVSYIFFSATESTSGLWSSSYFVSAKGIDPSVAARWTSYFFAGITVGRLVSGFMAMRVSSARLIRTGQITCIAGATLLMTNFSAQISMVGLILIGLGTAPVFPNMLHETPNRFGKEASQAAMGVQMAFCYMGAMFMPPIFGALATVVSIKIWPHFLLICILIMFVSSELLQKKIDARQAAGE